jgi:hypothetical protein
MNLRKQYGRDLYETGYDRFHGYLLSVDREDDVGKVTVPSASESWAFLLRSAF